MPLLVCRSNPQASGKVAKWIISLLPTILLRTESVALAQQNTHAVTRGLTSSSHGSGTEDWGDPVILPAKTVLFFWSKPKPWLQGVPLPSGPVQSRKLGLSLNEVNCLLLFRCLARIHFQPFEYICLILSASRIRLRLSCPVWLYNILSIRIRENGGWLHFKWLFSHWQNRINNYESKEYRNIFKWTLCMFNKTYTCKRRAT